MKYSIYVRLANKQQRSTVRPAIGLTVLWISLLVTGCGTQSTGSYDRDGAPGRPPDLSHVKDAVPRAEPRSRGGNRPSYAVLGQSYRVMASSHAFVERGIASWYGTKFHGRRTANGEVYDMYAMTGAHKHLPIPTYVRVSNLENGRSVVVRINDRGPFHRNRIIDLSYVAAHKLDMLKRGTAKVEVRTISPNRPSQPPTKVAAGMFLQAGAFSDRANAIRLRKKLENDLTQRIRIQTADGGHRLYRVQIGPLNTVAQIDKIAERLANLGIAETHVIID